MPNSTASHAAAEFAQYDFSHGLLHICTMSQTRLRASSGLNSPARVGLAGETKDRREHEADKSSEWRGRFSEHHQPD
jgi:hypothetical protein